MLKVKLILRIRIHVIVYLCFDYHSVSKIIAILISNISGRTGRRRRSKRRGVKDVTYLDSGILVSCPDPMHPQLRVDYITDTLASVAVM